MKRLATVLLVLATWPLLTAGGGVNPPSFTPKTDNALYTATIIMDPHMAAGDPVDKDLDGDGKNDFVPADVTPPSSKHATVYVRKGGVTVPGSFKVNPSFTLFRGCELANTDGRFLYTAGTNPTTMKAWVPPLALRAMFLPFGVNIDDTNATPAITAIRSAKCVVDPLNPTGAGGLLYTKDPETGMPTTTPADGGDHDPSGTKAGFLQLEVEIRILVPSP